MITICMHCRTIMLNHVCKNANFDFISHEGVGGGWVSDVKIVFHLQQNDNFIVIKKMYIIYNHVLIQNHNHCKLKV